MTYSIISPEQQESVNRPSDEVHDKVVEGMVKRRKTRKKKVKVESTEPVTPDPVSKAFILVGDATFTVEIPEQHRKGEPHYTYRVQHVEKTERWSESWFVKVLTGSDNENDYTYMGKLDPFTGQVNTTAKSAFPADSYRFRMVNKILARIWSDDHNAYQQHGFATHHEGRCGRCNRKLTVPESIRTGIGPECAKMVCGK